MIFVVIPVHNRKELTRNCLRSLVEQTFRNYKIIIIDDGSTDGTGEMIESEFPEVHIIKGDGNLWWTAATNLGVEYAIRNDHEINNNFVLTLNSDTVATNTLLNDLLESYNRAGRPSLVGATAVDAQSGKVLYRGEKINWLTESSRFFFNNPNRPSNGLIDVTVFPGRGLLIPFEVFKKIGVFDARNFPHYAADYDFTLKAKKSGFGLYCSWDAIVKIFPDESGSVMLRNKKTFKNYIEHISGKRGAAGIMIFIKYTFRHCPWYAMPFFLSIGLARRIFGYFIK